MFIRHVPNSSQASPLSHPVKAASHDPSAWHVGGTAVPLYSLAHVTVGVAPTIVDPVTVYPSGAGFDS